MPPASLKTVTAGAALRRRVRALRPLGGDSPTPQLTPEVRASANAIIGAVVLSEGLPLGREIVEKVRGVVVADDFGDDRHAMLWKSIEDLYEEGAPLDAISIAGRCMTYPRADLVFKSVDGDPLTFISSEVTCAVVSTDPSVVAWHAKTVATAARAYDAARDGEELAALAKRDPESFRKRVAELAAEAPIIPGDGAPRPQWTTPAQRALRIGQAVERMPFTISALNTATRGGLAPAKVVAIGGPPGGGKTSWLMQEALGWAKAGALVGILAADEEADGLLVRIGQQFGIDRGALEGGYPGARAELVAALEEYPNLLLVDSEEEDGATIEALATELALRRQPDQLAILILDSIQTVIPDGEEHRDARERVDTVVRTMKRCARRLRLAVIATSEISRGSYNTDDKARRTSPLAAFKESGGIEYGVALALVMSRYKDDSGEGIEVTTAKNRLGGHSDLPVFRLQMNARDATFREVDMPTDEDLEKEDVEKTNRMRTAVLKVIETAKVALTSKNLIMDRLKGAKDARGRALGASRSDWLKVIADLEDGHFIMQEGKGKPYVINA